MALKALQQSERIGHHDICLALLLAFQPSISVKNTPRFNQIMRL